MEALLLKYGYFAIFPISFFEGQLSTLVCGFLVHSGYLNLGIVFAIILCADICNDIMYYRLGRNFLNNSKVRNYIDSSHFLSDNRIIIEHLWERHPIKTMVLGKNAYMISVAIVASAGMIKMPFGRFLMYSIPASVIQPTILLFVGYHLGNSYELASQYIQYPGILILIIIILFIIGTRKLSKQLTAELKKDSQ